MRRRTMWVSGLLVVLVGAALVLAGVASAANMIYWDNFGNGTISAADLDGLSPVSTLASGFGDPNGLAFDASGDLYTVNDQNGAIIKVTPAGALLPFAGGFDVPVALAVDAAGNVYVSDRGYGAVFKVTPAGVISTFAKGFADVKGLAFDAAGNLYVADDGDGAAGDGTVSKVTPAGVVSPFAAGFNFPIGLAFDAAGNLYVANDSATGVNADTVSKVTPTAAVSQFATGFNYPVGLAFDAAGNLYVTNGGDTGINANTISKVSPTGVVSPFAGSADEPEFLALAEAPVGAGPPLISGPGTVGAPLSCSSAAWAPDPPGGTLFERPISVAVAWQLNGTDVPGASGSSFTPTQPGSYTCSNTATNQAGSGSQTSAALAVGASGVPSSVAPTVRSARQTNLTWREGNRLATIARKKKTPVGTMFSFSLNEQASVNLAFNRRMKGRKVKGRCVASTEKNRQKPKCTSKTTAGTLAFSGQPGLNKVSFRGRTSASTKLRPGSYTLVIVATASGRSSVPAMLRFTIVKQ
jgi:sugar lactone lactonase YvrE